MKITKKEFSAYEAVRRSGATNMFHLSRVEELSGLDEETIREIIHNYTELKQRFSEGKE